jgi:ferric-dicitrate binding protein FerR (iron transport regulator)
MSNHSPKPTKQSPSNPRERTEQAAPRPKAQRRRRHRLISLAYVLGLLLVFILSLLLLPADTGLGKLLWGGDEGVRQAL